MRLVLVFLLCMIRLYLVRPYLQAHLNTSLTLAEEFMNCSQRRILLLLRDRVSVLSLQGVERTADSNVIKDVWHLCLFVCSMRPIGSARRHSLAVCASGSLARRISFGLINFVCVR